MSGESLITRARNGLLAEFLANPQYPHLFCIDADIGFEAEAFYRQVESQHDVCGGVYPKEAVDVVLSGAHPNLGATITPQHLLANRNDMLVGGIKPHLYCLPILKTEEDRQALIGAREGREYAMGQRIAIRAVAAELAKRQLEFDIPEE